MRICDVVWYHAHGARRSDPSAIASVLDERVEGLMQPWMSTFLLGSESFGFVFHDYGAWNLLHDSLRMRRRPRRH